MDYKNVTLYFEQNKIDINNPTLLNNITYQGLEMALLPFIQSEKGTREIIFATTPMNKLKGLLKKK